MVNPTYREQESAVMAEESRQRRTSIQQADNLMEMEQRRRSLVYNSTIGNNIKDAQRDREYNVTAAVAAEDNEKRARVSLLAQEDHDANEIARKNREGAIASATAAEE